MRRRHLRPLFARLVLGRRRRRTGRTTCRSRTRGARQAPIRSISGRAGAGWSRFGAASPSWRGSRRKLPRSASPETRRQLDAQLAILILPRRRSIRGPLAAQRKMPTAPFAMAIGRATSREQVELAAASWLAEINRINGAVRAAQARIQRERDATDALAAELDRLTAIAEASRAMAEAAVAGLPRSAGGAGRHSWRGGRPAPPAISSERVGGGADLGARAAQAAPARRQPAATLAPAAIRRTAPAFGVRRPAQVTRAAAGGRPRAPLPNRRSQERRSSCAGRSRPRSFASCSATAPR